MSVTWDDTWLIYVGGSVRKSQGSVKVSLRKMLNVNFSLTYHG